MHFDLQLLASGWETWMRGTSALTVACAHRQSIPKSLRYCEVINSSFSYLVHPGALFKKGALEKLLGECSGIFSQVDFFKPILS